MTVRLLDTTVPLAKVKLQPSKTSWDADADHAATSKKITSLQVSSLAAYLE